MTTQQDLENRSKQLNPNHDAYWQSRGEAERPADWEVQMAANDSDSGR